jgi:hypothetical protein
LIYKSKDKNITGSKYFSWCGSIVVFPLVTYFALNMGKFTAIDYVNLLIHEGGHGVFIFFGKFIHALGGTLMQLIIPSMFVVFYWIHKKKFLTQLFLVWLGENFINISVYAADASARKLPLLGGNKVYHDWNYILQTTGLLENDVIIGNVIYGLGALIFLVALFIPLFIKEKEERVNLDLKL